MMDILMSETCWAHKKWNKIASDITLVFYSSISILFTYLFPFTSPRPFSLIIPFLLYPSVGIFSSHSYSLSPVFFRFCPSSVVPSPYSIFFVQFSIFGPFSLFSFLFFFIYFLPICLSLVHVLLFCVYIYPHSTVSFPLLYLIPICSCLVTQPFRQTVKMAADMTPFLHSQLTTRHISNCTTGVQPAGPDHPVHSTILPIHLSPQTL